ncbi:YhjD/YihY/BrkB family envelope integrity protein [Gordonia insulae]|uniref:YihY/virulence factor BrkB family protein n=1 Tax=Gordonia insulae TaxID=2420509 RepID=A0A3G8JUI0_9ACTN|nr:YhjD/YihY/BrkB family envelope integrity protein [Gordonia insulae]AZG48172.1 hypothetical protein D7316_04789 [Gordonia insulae]
MSSPSLSARAQQRALAAAQRARRVPGANLVLRILRDLAVNDVTDRSMTLAAQAFTSVLPIVILLTALPSHTVITKALSGLGIDPDSVDFVKSDPGSITTIGIFAALMTIAGATSLSRALGRMYVSIWQVTKLPISGWWRWVVVIFALPVGVVAQGFAAPLHTLTVTGWTIGGYGPIGVGLEVLATFLIWATMWTALPRLLVSSQVPMRLMALNGAVTGVFITVLLVGSRVFLPAILGETTRHYGTLGVVFVAISWLFFFAAIVVVCAIVVHSAVCDEGTVGSWLRPRVGTPRPFPRRVNDTFDEFFGTDGRTPARSTEP